MAETTGDLSVNFRADLNILFCRFVQPTSSALLRSGYENALKTALKNNTQYWLFDLRRRGPALAEDEKWIMEYFFPRVESLTHVHQYFAYLVTPSHYVHVRDDIGFDKLAHYSPLTDVRIFDSEEKATDWLVQNQTAETKA